MRLLFLFGALSIAPYSLHAQGALSEEQALRVLIPLHGISSYGRELRDVIARDSVIIRMYADVLEGRRPGPRGWQPSVILWWLAESGDPQYLEVFERYVSISETPQEFGAAVYGLARLIDRPSAHRSLELLARNSSRWQRAYTALALGYANTRAARSILRTIDSKDLPSWIAVKRDSVLSGQAMLNEIGRGPCMNNEVFRQDRTGAVRCLQSASDN